MIRALRHLPSLVTITVLAAVALPCASALGAGSTSPLPESEYGVRRSCTAPSEGHASCMAERLVPLTAKARAYNHPLAVVRPAGVAQPAKSPLAGDFGLRPQDIHSAYSLPAEAPGEPVLALIDAYNDPTAEADLKRYEETFGASTCKTSCFTQVNQKGQSGSANLPFPKTLKELEKAEAGSEGEVEEAEEAIGWGMEEALDFESARATCPNCRLLLVEAKSSSYPDLEEAVRSAESLGASVISNSWGGPEEGVASDSTFNDPHTVITASSGDDGYLGWDQELGFTNFPASSPHVVAVGGTRLTLGAGGSWQSEKTWNDAGGINYGYGASGGGCSTRFIAPSWQQAVSGWSSVGCENRRSVVDVAADGDPYSGVALTATNPEC